MAAEGRAGGGEGGAAGEGAAVAERETTMAAAAAVVVAAARGRTGAGDSLAEGTERLRGQAGGTLGAEEELAAGAGPALE